MILPEYKSPRKVQEEIQRYSYERFESYMKLADDGVLERALAITAFKDELVSDIWTEKTATLAK